MDTSLTACASCGTSNPSEALWCGQCYVRFESADEVRPSEVARSPAASGWVCKACGNENDLSETYCATCGSSMYATFTQDEDVIDRSEALRASIVPGLGMLRVGLAAEGILSGLLVTFAVGAGLAMAIAGNGGSLILVAMGLAIWAATARDAVAAAAGYDNLWLTPRTISVTAGAIIITAAILILRTPLGDGG